MAPLRALAAAAVVAAVAACGGDGNGSAPPPAATGKATTTTAAVITTTPSRPAVEVAPGTAVVEAGEERFTFIVFQCLIGAETGSPGRRLALSAGDSEPFPESAVVLNVDILVSARFGTEDHVITIARDDGPDLGAADAGGPARGGPAGDDWIEVDEERRTVQGSRFELRATDGSGLSLPSGRLVADCPRA